MITKKVTSYAKPKYAIAMASMLMLGATACTRMEDRGVANTTPVLDGDVALVEATKEPEMETTTEFTTKEEEVKLQGEVPVTVSTKCEIDITKEPLVCDTLVIVGEVAVFAESEEDTTEVETPQTDPNLDEENIEFDGIVVVPEEQE